MADNWVSPTGHNDPDSVWRTESYAYDDDLGEYAWTPDAHYYLELTHSAITCDKVRIYANRYVSATPYDPDIDIDVYYGSAWHNIFSGTVTKDTWVEKAIGSVESVTAARVKANSLGGASALRLFEFDFNSLPPVVDTDACTSVRSTSFDANGDITVSGGATTRGFHYSKVFDGFEWGSDTDPLDDSGGAITWTISVAGTSKAEIDTAQHYSGTRSARLYRDGTNNPTASFSLAAGTTYGISFEGMVDGSSSLAISQGSGVRRFLVLIDADEKVYYYNHNAVKTDTGVTVTANQWFSIRIENLDFTTGFGSFDLYVGGVFAGTYEMLTSGIYNGKVVFWTTKGTASSWMDNVGVWDVEDESGSFSEGEYSLPITGLDPSTTYYVQAFAKNAAGFGYGAVVSQATAPAADHRRSSFFKMF